MRGHRRTLKRRLGTQIWPMKLVIKIERGMRADINIQVGGKIMLKNGTTANLDKANGENEDIS